MSLIDIKNLSFAYDGSAEKVFDNVSFQIDTGWRLGFTGRNGRGKTTFLKLLMGELEYTGSISASVSFDYFPIALHDTSRPAAEALAEVVSDGEEWRLRREMAMLGLDEALLDRPFDSLSGGERTKLQLAAMFTNENDFLLIDEPTNHLDEAGRERVARYLRRKRGFILVSHDRAFLDGCVDHILSINRADIEVTQGDLSTWLENKERRDRYELAENDRLKKEIGRLEAAAREKAQWADRAERAKIGFDPTRTEKSMGRRAYEGAKSKKSMKRAKAIDRRIQDSIEQKSELLKNLETADDLKLSPLRHYSERLLELRELEIDYGAGALAAGSRDILGTGGYTAAAELLSAPGEALGGARRQRLRKIQRSEAHKRRKYPPYGRDLARGRAENFIHPAGQLVSARRSAQLCPRAVH